MKCNNCNSIINKGESFCSKCGQPVNNTTKKSNNIITIIICIVCLLIGFGGGYLLGTKLSEKKVPSNIEELNNKEDNQNQDEDKDNTSIDGKVAVDLDIETIGFEYESGSLQNIDVISRYKKPSYEKNRYTYMFLCKNNNDVALELTAYFNFMNESGQRIDRTIDTIRVNKGQYFVLEFNNKAKESYSNAKVSIKANKVKSYDHIVELTEKDYKVDLVGNEIRVDYKNNTKNDLSIMALVIFYKDNKIIYFNDAFINSKVGTTESGKVYLSQLPGYDYNTPVNSLFDKYEVSISSSYYYDKEY